MESAQRLDGVSPATVQHWLPQQRECTEGGGPEDVNDGVKSHRRSRRTSLPRFQIIWHASTKTTCPLGDVVFNVGLTA